MKDHCKHTRKYIWIHCEQSHCTLFIPWADIHARLSWRAKGFYTQVTSLASATPCAKTAPHRQARVWKLPLHFEVGFCVTLCDTKTERGRGGELQVNSHSLKKKKKNSHWLASLSTDYLAFGITVVNSANGHIPSDRPLPCARASIPNEPATPAEHPLIWLVRPDVSCVGSTEEPLGLFFLLRSPDRLSVSKCVYRNPAAIFLLLMTLLVGWAKQFIIR